MKIAIIGFGLEGRAAYEYYKDGNEITVCDRDTGVVTPPDVNRKVGDDYLNHLNKFDLIIRSPHVHPWLLIAANSPKILEKVTTNTNEFFRVSPSKNIVGITGTKGKGTTSSLIAEMLRKNGKTVHLGGNIGLAALDLLKNGIGPDDWVVLELSSFQLIDLRYGPHIGVCLMITDEHLDWHTDMDEYTSAKSHLFAQQTEADTAVYYADNPLSVEIASAGVGKKIPYFKPPGAYVETDAIMIDGQVICRTDELKLLGQHNWQNACAAVTTVWQIAPNLDVARDVLQNFGGLEHRIEFVSEVAGVKYYDDSFGTTPQTASVAVQTFGQPKVLILGGSDKGAAYDDLAQQVTKSNIRKVLLIGHQGPAIQASLDKAGFSNYIAGGTDMTEIVNTARQQAQPGDVVLLSPGCASFDMFQDYKDRGDKFKAAVRALSANA